MKMNEIVGRPARHWMEDGSVELAFGIQAVLTGAVFLIGQISAPDSTFSKVYSFLAAGLWGCVIFGSQWAIKRLKERLVAPRAGYVVLPEAKWRFSSGRTLLWITPVGAVVFFLFLTFMFQIPIDNFRRSPWVVGFGCALVFAVISIWSAVYYKMPRYFLLALWSACFAVWIYGRGSDSLGPLMMLMVWIGFGYAAIGAWRVVEFLRANPRFEQSGE